MPGTRIIPAAFAVLTALFVFSCAMEDTTRPTAPVEEASAPTSPHHGERFIPLPPAPPLPPGWSVLECGYTNQKTARATPNGALLGVDVVALAVLPQAVPEHVRFIITESETRVEATIETTTGHIRFQRPVELAMSFNRCGPNFHADPGQRLAIWRYRPETGWVNLGGTVDNFNQLIRVQITEISRYAVGLSAPVP